MDNGTINIVTISPDVGSLTDKENIEDDEMTINNSIDQGSATHSLQSNFLMPLHEYVKFKKIILLINVYSYWIFLKFNLIPYISNRISLQF